MKDVAILTKYYKNYNYGGMLQGYAMHYVIEKLGFEADIISYDVKKNKNAVYPNIISQMKQYDAGAIFLKVEEKIIAKGNCAIKNILYNRIEKFNEFEKSVNADTELYNDEDIINLNKFYKIFVSGSDQIWNPNAVRNIYLQTFVNEEYRKISYAASIGRESFSDLEEKTLIPAIQKFGLISVREKTAQNLLEKYIDKPIVTVIDPTMLLNVEEWNVIAEKRLVDKKYALFYFFSGSFEIRKKAKKICEQYGWSMVMIPYAKQEFKLTDSIGPGEKMNFVGPKEFVSLVKNAEFVFTDSFHGAVFSLIYKIPFAVFERNKSGHVSMNSRLYDLLDLFEERKRLITIQDMQKLVELVEIDSPKIEKIISEYQKKSLEFLKGAIDKGSREYEYQKKTKRILGKENECSGCGICQSFCPKNCIKMESNQNGFLIPIIDQNRCIECGKCKEICSMLNPPVKNNPIVVYGAYTKEKEKNSSSGGIGYILAKSIIENGGVVYGAAYTDKMSLKIIRLNSLEQLNKIQGSKYFQADMQNVINQVIDDLSRGIKVLFTGTPCYVAGVINAVKNRKLEDNLLTAEIICHGVPSPKMFKDYLNWMEKKLKKEITDYHFRSQNSSKDFMLQIKFSDGKEKLISGFKDVYYKAFLSSKWFRSSCYNCPFSYKERVADITMGDFWNAQTLPYKFGKNRRISVVLVNTENGKSAFENINDKIETIETTWKVAAEGNSNLFQPTKKDADYKGYGEVNEHFFEDQMASGLDIKKFLFNQLPINMRRIVKKIRIRMR